ncbi:MAG: four helix bundle protein [Candidatus Doudnabacteria bacterium]|nr:four helix bundle protein [Candidatus Doudnabacteria bacterium]
MNKIPNLNTQITNKLQIPNGEKLNKPYDLEERTFEFAKAVAVYCKQLPKNASNLEYGKQCIRSSASSGANYIEANESLSKKDFLMRIKICRKEAKESAYWLRLIVETNDEPFSREGNSLMNEAIELKKIFSSILEKSV